MKHSTFNACDRVIVVRDGEKGLVLEVHSHSDGSYYYGVVTDFYKRIFFENELKFDLQNYADHGGVHKKDSND